MGEIALRQIQAALESSRGVAVYPPTRKWYGVLTMTREQPGRYADEQRGVFTKHFRRNPKLVQAGFKYTADATFEDLPYFAEMFIQGGVAPPVGSATTGYVWTYNPDMSVDSLKTRTIYAGDDTVQWQGPFAAADQADITMALDDALKLELSGFVKEWYPVGVGWTGGFSALSDRVVESVMGWQHRLFVDPPANPMGTTQVLGKFISAKAGWHLNNKKKNFGDYSNLALQKLGRGSKDITADFVFEGLNQSEFTDHQANIEKVVRVQALGSAIAGTTFGTTNGALNAGTQYSAIVTNALTAAVPGGVGISIGGVVFTVAPAGAASAATSIPVIPYTPTVTVASGATVMAAKTINLDFWGFWETFGIGERETNTTFALNLMGVYDATAGFDHRIIVQNGNNQAAGIS